MKIAILWTRLSGYLDVCLKELAAREGVELFLSYKTAATEAPFSDIQFECIPNRLAWQGQPDFELLRARIEDFVPDVLVCAGWHVRAYRSIAREYENKCFRVLGMDNPWQATLKQWLGVLSSRFYVRTMADAVWVPGERQADFARRMGFRQSSIMRGLYSCDQRRMAAVHLRRIADHRPVPRKFVFVGRFVSEKGIETLVRAYELYREMEPDRWPLVCCGAGPLRSMFDGKAGIRVQGFVQPNDLPSVYAAAGCLVLPSLFEPWALVVHEAASAGLLILASEKVGASVHLVQPFHNGFISTCGDAIELADLMSRVSKMSDASLERMSCASHRMSHQFSPAGWADALLDSYHQWKETSGH